MNAKSKNKRQSKTSSSLKKVNNKITNIERRLSSIANVAYANGSTSKSTNRAMATVRVRNRERISTVSAVNGNFTAASLKINPGLSASFPWLSNIAKMFDKYRFESLTFHFKTFVPTSTAGSVSLAYDPNTLDPVPTTGEALTHETKWSTNSAWKSFSINIDCKRVDFLYTRTGQPDGTVDLKTYDLGQLILATEGVPALSLGYVEVDYDILLRDKQPL